MTAIEQRAIPMKRERFHVIWGIDRVWAQTFAPEIKICRILGCYIIYRLSPRSRARREKKTFREKNKILLIRITIKHQDVATKFLPQRSWCFLIVWVTWKGLQLGQAIVVGTATLITLHSVSLYHSKVLFGQTHFSLGTEGKKTREARGDKCFCSNIFSFFVALFLPNAALRFLPNCFFYGFRITLFWFFVFACFSLQVLLSPGR